MEGRKQPVEVGICQKSLLKQTCLGRGQGTLSPCRSSLAAHQKGLLTHVLPTRWAAKSVVLVVLSQTGKECLNDWGLPGAPLPLALCWARVPTLMNMAVKWKLRAEGRSINKEPAQDLKISALGQVLPKAPLSPRGSVHLDLRLTKRRVEVGFVSRQG